MDKSKDDLTFSSSSVAFAVAFSTLGDWNKSLKSDMKLSISSKIFPFMISRIQFKIYKPNSFCSEIWGLLYLPGWNNTKWDESVEFIGYYPLFKHFMKGKPFYLVGFIPFSSYSEEV